MINFCSLFDSGYLTRGIAMIDSLIDHTEKIKFHVYILALDFVTESFLREYYNSRPEVTVRTLGDLGLVSAWQVRKGRNHSEFCWALSAIFSNTILEDTHQPTIYLDADLLFFSDPTILISECAENSVAAIPHRFPKRLRSRRISGEFNVQWVYFKFDLEGRTASSTWRKQCEESSSYAPERGIVGDQKYLDSWTENYPTFKAISHVGAGLAPWNHESYKIEEINKCIYVDGVPLIFYHFHSFNISDSGKVRLANSIYQYVSPLPEQIYSRYLQKLVPITEKLSSTLSIPNPSIWRTQRRPGIIRKLFGRALLLTSK